MQKQYESNMKGCTPTLFSKGDVTMKFGRKYNLPDGSMKITGNEDIVIRLIDNEHGYMERMIELQGSLEKISEISSINGISMMPKHERYTLTETGVNLRVIETNMSMQDWTKLNGVDAN